MDLFTIGLFLIWEAAVRILKIPEFFLPPPTAVAKAFVDYAGAAGRNSWITFETTMIGFALAVGFGMLLGLLVGWSRAIYAGLYPLMIGFNAIPKVALVPILVLWFGIGFIPAVLTAFLISFFPIVVNVATGLATIEPELEDVLKALGASKLDIMRKVGIPRYAALFLRIAEGGDHARLCRLGDFRKRRVQLRYRQSDAAGAGAIQGTADLRRAWSALALEGIAMYAAMAILERRMTGWAQRSGFAQA